MKSMVVSKLKALISDEVNKQLAENYQELLSKLVKIDVEHMEEDMSYAIGAAYFMIGGRLIFTPVIYRDGSVDSISYIGDVENDKLYGLTKKMYKKMTSVMAHDFGEVMSKKNEERASVDAGIVGQLFATPRTYSPKVASEESDAVILSAMNNKAFRDQFVSLTGNADYVDALDGVYGEFVIDRANDLGTFEKVATDVPVAAGKRRYESIASLKYLPLEKRASAAIEIARNGFYEAGVILDKVAAVNMPKFGEQLVSSSGNTVIAKTPGVYNFIGKDYGLVKGFIGRMGFSNDVMLVIPNGAVNIEANGGRDDWSRSRSGQDGYLALEGSFFTSPTQTVSDTLSALQAKIKSKEKKKRNSLSYVGEERVENRTIIVSPNSDEIYIFKPDSNPVSVGDKKVYYISYYDEQDIELIIDPSCKRFVRTSDRAVCNPNMVSYYKDSLYGKFSEEVKASLLGTRDIDNPIVKTAEFTVGYKAGAYSLNSSPMPLNKFKSALSDRGFNASASRDIVKVAEAGQGEDVAMNEMSQTLKAILAEITENKHATAKVLELMSQAQSQASEDGVQQEDNPETVQAIQEMAQMLGANGEQMIAQAKEQGVPLEEIAGELNKAVEQQGGQEGSQESSQAPQANVQPQEQGGQVDQPTNQQEVDMQGIKSEGFNQNMTPEMVQQLKEISDKDMFNAAIISYFVDASNAGDIISKYIEEIDGGVVAMAKVMLFVETQKGKMTETIGEKQISVFINRGKNILNRMTDFVIDATLIQ